jgi:hypothetical protein
MSISTFEGTTGVRDGDGDDYVDQGARAAEDYANGGAADGSASELVGGRGFTVIDIGRNLARGAMRGAAGIGGEAPLTDRIMPVLPGAAKIGGLASGVVFGRWRLNKRDS